MTFKLKINPVLEQLVPGLSAEDESSLDASVQEHGQWKGFPLTVAEDGDILDGMNRYKKFLKYKVEAKYVIDNKIKTLEQKKMFVIQNVLARRHLNNWQRGLLGIELMKLIEKPEGKKSEIVSKQVPGLKVRTFDKVIVIDKKANATIRKKLDSGSMSVNTAYKLVTKSDRNLPKVPLPTEEHDVFLVDIPIKWDDEGVRGSADNHYPTMTKEEIMQEKVPSAKDAIMFFWIPSAFLLDGTALEILRAWAFEPVAEFIWRKHRIGGGSWNRNQHETLIIAVKGKMPMPAKLFPSIIDAERKAHSEKPAVVYEMIEEMYPKRKYCELYSRASRLGWTSHGNQVKEITKIHPKKVHASEKGFVADEDINVGDPVIVADAGLETDEIDVRVIPDKKESVIEKLRKSKK